MRIGTLELAETAPGVFYAPDGFVAVGDEIVAFLKQAAGQSPTRRARLCAHPSQQSVQHDMLVVTAAGSYVAPHRHLEKSETFLVVEGEASALLFEDDGTLQSVIAMGPPRSGRTFFYRMPPRRFHGLQVHSDHIVFLESTLGPFDPAASENAPWAPAPDETEAGLGFVARCLDLHG